MAADNAAAWPRDAEIPLTDVRSVPKTGLARPPPTQQTARKGRLNFLYADFSTILPEEIQCAQDALNNRPRKRHRFLTPSEVFFHHSRVALRG